MEYECDPIETERNFLTLRELLGQNGVGSNFIYSNHIPHSDDLTEIIKQCDNEGFIGGRYKATDSTPQIKTVVYVEKNSEDVIQIPWASFVKLGKSQRIVAKQTLEAS